MRRAPEDVYESLIAVGFPRDSAITLTAIAGAESGYDPAAVGDVALQDQKWGPSYGLFQVRTVKAELNSGGVRDIARLTTGDIAQAQAAYAISQGGQDFTPWSVYNTGAYQAHLAAARAAAARVDGGAGDGGTGPAWLPWNWADAASEKARDAVLGGARHIGLEAAAVVAGLALVGLGLWVFSRPGRAQFGRAQQSVRGAVGL